jgi:hypothetical protein
MTEEQFAHWSLIIGVGALILYMLYIIYRLAKDSEAPRFGYIALFISLGLGIFGFVAKAILEQFLHV